MLNLVKVAAVIDAAADHLDAIESDKLSTVQAERQAQVDKLAASYVDATGEEMPDGIRQKLATSDKDVVALVTSMIEKQAGRVESLGGPSDKDDAQQPVTLKEAAVAADERFLSWALS